ncbi:hypothetical protein X797_008083 [Metarhizium robertsii]|uniref:F-box domain protein n=2 Tax=Metarhizium robertsii TaxID=568076 RepID=E9EJI9_METRA|nr:uncharacterized protein MAA_00059 [Metarhizium robertsii ARSEF 23]EFZ02985.1 hypothetical protein MAA_00059 [Metarhizium robertsii ARSEF 23]EXU98846.1 hypothetical protein X797_008083 [Metarhizium robertsii]
MDSLPTEIIQHICKQLCFHCQHQGVFPNADSRDVLAHKSSLSRLCSTSKRLSVIAQPVLYHYYATGNLPTTAGFGLNHAIRASSGDDKLSLFVRTIMQRPDLAGHVRALQLVDSDVVKGCSLDLLRAFETKAEECGMRVLEDDSSLSDVDSFYEDQPLSSLEGHRWLEGLAIALSPNIEMLLIAHNTPSRPFVNVDINLSRLAKLAIRGYSGQYFFSEAIPLLSAAPNMQTLYLLDCCHLTGWNRILDVEFQPHFELALANLRSLVINGPHPEHLEEILGYCCQLQDLEYYEQTTIGVSNVRQLVESFLRVKRTLRRLYFAYLPRGRFDFNCGFHRTIEGLDADEQYRDYVECSLAESYDTSAIELLRDFEQLEELGIDQASIYSPSSPDAETNPGRLSRLLPPNIQRLRVMYVYRAMTGDLYCLGRQAPYKFPELKHVRLGQAISITPERQAGLEEMRQISSIATTMGETISVSWAVDELGADVRTRIPGGTVHPQFIPCPVN